MLNEPSVGWPQVTFCYKDIRGDSKTLFLRRKKDLIFVPETCIENLEIIVDLPVWKAEAKERVSM